MTILKKNYPVQGRLLSWPRFQAFDIGYVTKHGLNVFVIPHFNSTNYLALSRRFCSTIIRFQTFTVVWVERNVFFPTSAPRLVADYSCSVRTYCARLSLPKSEWTYHFVQGLNSEIREYVILQQPGTFEAAENFALLKEFVLVSSVKPQVLDVKEMSTQVNEELKEIVTPKDKTIGSLNQQSSGFSKLDMQQIIREELQQFLSNAVPNSNGFRQRRPNLKVRKIHSRIGDRICHNCGGKGHLRYNCPAESRRLFPRYKDSRQNDGPHQQKGQSSYNWNSNQGNGPAPLSRFEINS